MKKSILSTFIMASVFSFANGQVFELQDNSTVSNTVKTNPPVPNAEQEEDDIIVDKTAEEIVVAPSKPIHQVDKWMSIVQAKERNYMLIEQSLQSGQNPNQSIFDSSTMLHVSAWQNDERLFRLGLQYGGLITNTNKNGETVLHWAAYSNNPNIINLVLSDKNISKIINKQNKVGRTPLHFNALKWSNLDVAKALIANNADLNIADIHGQTPLHYALGLRKWNLAKFYIDSGADITIADKDGDALDQYMLINGDIEGFKILYKYLTPKTQELIKIRLGNINLTL